MLLANILLCTHGNVWTCSFIIQCSGYWERFFIGQVVESHNNGSRIIIPVNGSLGKWEEKKKFLLFTVCSGRASVCYAGDLSLFTKSIKDQIRPQTEAWLTEVIININPKCLHLTQGEEMISSLDRHQTHRWCFLFNLTTTGLPNRP